MTPQALPGIPPEAAEAAGSTLGGAVAVADGLPGAVATLLLGTARAAFTDAVQLVAVICAALMVLLAIGVALLFERRTIAAGSRSAR